jgi:uncharacterized protein YbjT (DUF2867 family)
MTMMLVTGATGNFGSAAVSAARAAGFEVRALAHSPERAAPLRAQGIDVAVGDMSQPESLAAAFRGVTKLLLISAVSPALVDMETKTLQVAKRAGVKRVVKISALSVGTKHQAGLGDLHAAAEAALRDSGMEWTVLRPAATMGTPLRVGKIEDGVLYAPCADGVAAYAEPADVGELGARLLEQGGHAGEAYSVTGPEALDLARIAAIVTAATGRSLRYEATDDADYARRLEASGVPRPVIALNISFFQRVRAGVFAEVHKTVETLLGRPGTSYAEWAKANAAPLLPT